MGTGLFSTSVGKTVDAGIKAVLRFFHQRGIMTRTPMKRPQAKVTSTTSTRGACHKVPKKKRTATVCWLFSAKAKSVKKMAALSSHIRYFTGSSRSGLAIVARPLILKASRVNPAKEPSAILLFGYRHLRARPCLVCNAAPFFQELPHFLQNEGCAPYGEGAD